MYELIFMKFPNESICMDDDVQTYKSILLMTNAHRHGHSPNNQIMCSKGYKYKNIIAPLVSGKKIGIGINKRVDLPHTITLNDNKIDYIHWDNSNEIVCGSSAIARGLAPRGSQWTRQRNSIDYRRASRSWMIINFVLHTSFS